MQGKIADKIYVPYLMMNGIETAIGSNQFPGFCGFFEVKRQAERYLEEVKKQNPNIANCEGLIMEFTKGVPDE